MADPTPPCTDSSPSPPSTISAPSLYSTPPSSRQPNPKHPSEHNSGGSSINISISSSDDPTTEGSPLSLADNNNTCTSSPLSRRFRSAHNLLPHVQHGYHWQQQQQPPFPDTLADVDPPRPRRSSDSLHVHTSARHKLWRCPSLGSIHNGQIRLRRRCHHLHRSLRSSKTNTMAAAAAAAATTTGARNSASSPAAFDGQASAAALSTTTPSSTAATTAVTATPNPVQLARPPRAQPQPQPQQQQPPPYHQPRQRHSTTTTTVPVSICDAGSGSKKRSLLCKAAAVPALVFLAVPAAVLTCPICVYVVARNSLRAGRETHVYHSACRARGHKPHPAWVPPSCRGCVFGG